MTSGTLLDDRPEAGDTRMRKTLLSRRQVGVGAAAAAVTGALPRPLFTNAFGQEKITLTVATYGGPYQEAQTKAFFDPFEKANRNVTIAQDPSAGDAKIKAMVEIGDVAWDVVVISPNVGFDTDGEWFVPIDYSVVDRAAFLPGQAGTYRVGVDLEGSVISYRTDKFDVKPRGFASFFDTKGFPGKRAVRKFAEGGLMEAALLVDGVPKDKLYPLDLPRAFKKLDSIKSSLVWWDSGAEAIQLMTSGETTMGLLWLSGAVLSMNSAPTQIDWTNWISDGGFWAVPKGSKQAALAMKAIASFTQPEHQAAFTKFLPYAPTTYEGAKITDPRFKGNLPTEHLDTVTLVNFEWWHQNMTDIEREFQSWLIS